LSIQDVDVAGHQKHTISSNNSSSNGIPANKMCTNKDRAANKPAPRFDSSTVVLARSFQGSLLLVQLVAVPHL
jgi:hypothetical protein